MASILFRINSRAYEHARFSRRYSQSSRKQRAGGAGSESRNRLGRTLVAVEMALALVLVIGAGLFLRTLITLETLNPGFRTDHLLTFSIPFLPSSAKFSDEKSAALD